MPIYDRPARVLMGEWARRNVGPGEVFEKSAPVRWFAEHYPKIKSNTVAMHVESMAVNNPLRRHFHGVHEGSGHDLFFKVGLGRFRLWEKERDPAPRYKVDFDAAGVAEGGLDAGVEGDFDESGPVDGAEPAVGSTAFALERSSARA